MCAVVCHGNAIATFSKNSFSFSMFQLGDLIYFSLEYWTGVVKFRHSCGIKSIYCNPDDTKLLFIDDHNQGYIYCPVSSSRGRISPEINPDQSLPFQTSEDTVLIPNLPKNCKGALWDCANGKAFVLFDDKVCILYVFVKYSVQGKLRS